MTTKKSLRAGNFHISENTNTNRSFVGGFVTLKKNVRKGKFSLVDWEIDEKGEGKARLEIFNFVSYYQDDTHFNVYDEVESCRCESAIFTRDQEGC